jgi:fumarate hydratase class I
MAIIKINLPVSEEEIRKLKVGDQVLLSGVMSTGRDGAHKYIMEHHPDFIRPYIKDSILYHCGPVVGKNEDGTWKFVAAGPTTSIREEPYEAHVIEEYQLRGVIGKGGMREKTLAALKKNGAVYFHAVGGAAVSQAVAVKEVLDVFLLEELGVPEAFWIIRVEDFPVVVTMDSNGDSLHDVIREKSSKIADALIGD